MRTRCNWRTSYFDDVTGKVIHLIDRADDHNFAWVTRHCGISSSTLRRMRDAGMLRVYENADTLTRTTWVFEFMQAYYKAKGRASSGGRTSHGNNQTRPGIVGTPVGSERIS